MLRDGLNGFACLRTRPSMPLVSAPEKRRCRICGAVLSRYNSTDTCCSHMGVVDIPHWAEALVDEHGILTADLVQVVSGRLPVPRAEISANKVARDQAMRQAYATGEWSLAELAREFGVSQRTAKDICRFVHVRRRRVLEEAR